MSTRRTDYVMVGLMLEPNKNPIEKTDYETFDYLEDNSYKVSWEKESLQRVYDGMCGNFVCFGFILAKSTEDGDGLGVRKISGVSKMKAKVAEALLVHKVPNPLNRKLGLYVFTLWH